MKSPAQPAAEPVPKNRDSARTVSRPVSNKPGPGATEGRAGAHIDPLDLANALRPTLLHLGRHLRRELHSLGVSGSQASILGIISRDPNVGVRDLAEREGMSGPSVCSHLDRLEALGLIGRERSTGADRRRVSLRVTAEGARVLRAVRSRRTAWLAARVESLDAGQRHALLQAVDALTQLVPGK